jgi:signal transduction histidine kinase
VYDVAAVGDRDALRQVLLILVDNALKHTLGAVTVSAEAAEERVALHVQDTGPGIGAEELDRIFERFYKGQGTSVGPNIGLGLAIAKALIETQGGEIAVESQANQGSTFSIILPQAIPT